MSTADGENQFTQFRKRLYHEHFNNRNAVLMELLDAEYQPGKAALNLAELAAPYIPPLWKGRVYLLAVDTTPCPRPYAFKLSERECVYKPTPIKGQLPITYGHEYSHIGLPPERSQLHSPAWVIPLSAQRVSRENREQLTITQMRSLLENASLPFGQRLCLQLADAKYSTPAYLAAFSDKPNLISIVRSRGNRKYYFPASAEIRTKARGHPSWYGKQMKLKKPETWPQPDEETSLLKTSRKGKAQSVKIQAWHNILMRGKCKQAQLPMHRYPFTLVRIVVYNDRQELVFAHPLWLIVMGQERHQLSLQDIYEAFQERSCMEHFFRFTKQKLLLDKFQTPETAHEENWWQIATLAYLQLWIAQQYASCLPRPWERHLPRIQAKHLSPTMVQRSFTEIIRQFGTPSKFPKPRNKSP